MIFHHHLAFAWQSFSPSSAILVPFPLHQFPSLHLSKRLGPLVLQLGVELIAAADRRDMEALGRVSVFSPPSKFLTVLSSESRFPERPCCLSWLPPSHILRTVPPEVSARSSEACKSHVSHMWSLVPIWFFPAKMRSHPSKLE